MKRDTLPIGVFVKQIGMDEISVTLVYLTGTVTHVMSVDIAGRLRDEIGKEL